MPTPHPTSRIRRRTTIVLSCVALSLCTYPLRAQTERRQLDGASVSVFNLAGRMRIEPGTSPDIVVEVTRGGRDAATLRVESGQLDGRNTLRVIYPDDDIVYAGSDAQWRSSTQMNVRRDGTWGRGRGDRRMRISTRGSGTEAWADVRVLVPAGKSIDAHVGLGEMSVSRVNASLTLDVSAGRIGVTSVRGALHAETGSGGITIDDANVSVLSAESGSGGISITNVVAPTCKVETGSGGIDGTGADCEDFTVDTGSGGVRLAAVRSKGVRVETGSGGVTLGLMNSPQRANVETGSGSVTISAPASLSVQVDIVTGSGGIDSDFPLRTNRFERHRVQGTIGDGIGTLSVETGSGGVRLRRN